MAKKVLIAVLVIMTVFSASVFARDGFDNYSGISIGFGFSKVKLTDGGLEYKQSSNPLVISAIDYGFFDRSPVGAFAQIGVTIPLNFKVNDVQNDNWVAGITASLGPAFKFDMGNSMSILLGAGFYFYTTTWTNYSDTAKLQRNYFGAGADIQASYKVGRNFAITAGASVEYYFANYSKIVYKYWRETTDVSYSSYSEFRVLPKIAGYYIY